MRLITVTDKPIRATLASIGVFCTIGIASCSSNRAMDVASTDVFSLFVGEWGENVGHTCESNPHTISFSKDGKLAIFEYQQPPDGSSQDTVLYHVLGHGDTWIAVRRDGETILNHMNTPLVWKLYLTRDLNGYRWWLYGSVAWRKSLSRGIRCEPFAIKGNAVGGDNIGIHWTSVRWISESIHPGQVLDKGARGIARAYPESVVFATEGGVIARGG